MAISAPESDNTLEIPQAIDLSFATPSIKPHLFSIVTGINLLTY